MPAGFSVPVFYVGSANQNSLRRALLDVYGDLVCRGCKRFHHEVVNWNAYGSEEKRAVWCRLEALLAQVMAAKLEVFDAQRLRAQLEARGIRFVADQSEYCWAYQLIARGARLIQQLEAYGVHCCPNFATGHCRSCAMRSIVSFSCCRRRITIATSHRDFSAKVPISAFDGMAPRQCLTTCSRWSMISSGLSTSTSLSRASSTTSAVLPISAPEKPVRATVPMMVTTALS